MKRKEVGRRVKGKEANEVGGGGGRERNRE